ncbi:hypothetical protein ACFS6H_04340 [Terrimonas rubra]|uniref:Lipocalin-like domain-containing protein n=1 Tax=Terrimonas rubra TaxID=1035890 RepID=A0ABW6A0X2_9BACT
MKTKNFPGLLVFTLCASFFITSCKKDKDDKPSLQGYWAGKYGNTTAYPTQPFAILLRNNGTARILANNADTTAGAKAEGTYTISGSTLTCTYTYIPPGSGTYSLQAEVNNIFTFMEGGWGNGTSTTNGGKFYFVKK